MQGLADPYRDTEVIDSRAPRFNQATIGVLSLVAVLTGWHWLVGLLGLQLVVGLTIGRRFCVACVAYFELVQPRLGEGPLEDSRPPRAANVVGAVVLSPGTLASAAAAPAPGAALTALVAALALLAATTGFCTGCEAYKLGCRLTGRPFVFCPLPPPARHDPASAGSPRSQTTSSDVLVGMTGMGGGSLMTPLLILVFGFDPK